MWSHTHLGWLLNDGLNTAANHLVEAMIRAQSWIPDTSQQLMHGFVAMLRGTLATYLAVDECRLQLEILQSEISKTASLLASFKIELKTAFF